MCTLAVQNIHQAGHEETGFLFGVHVCLSEYFDLPYSLIYDCSVIWVHQSHISFMQAENNKLGIDLHRWPQSLMSAIVVNCLDNIIIIVSISDLSRP